MGCDIKVGGLTNIFIGIIICLSDAILGVTE